MKNILTNVTGILCNIKALIYDKMCGFFAKKVLFLRGVLVLAFTNRVFLFLIKSPLSFAKKILLFFIKAPLSFAKKVLFFRGVLVFCVKKYLYILFSLAVAMAVFGSSFISCSPDFADQNSTNPTDNTSDSKSNDEDDDPDETCDDNEGDPCKGNETCERVCEAIFEEYGEVRACINTGDETVDKLQKVHNLLMGKNAGVTSGQREEVTRSPAEVEDDLNKIGEDDDGVERSAFRCYLEIGASKYIARIKKGLSPHPVAGSDSNAKKRERLIKTLKWLVEDDKKSAEILADVNAGDDILSAILKTLVTAPIKDSTHDATHSIDGTEYRASHPDPPNSRSDANGLNHGIWWLSSSTNGLNIRYYRSSSGHTGVIELDSAHDKILYTALSRLHGNDMSNRNIFSYSAKYENQHIFNLAFEELSDVCTGVENKSADHDKACARALMCWTSWQEACDDASKGSACTASPSATDKSVNNKLWDDMLDEHKSALGGSNDNNRDCSSEKFADFFSK